jgi:Dyp-type peroxidase family
VTAALADSPELPAVVPLPLADIQGNVLRGYRFSEVLHLFGRVDAGSAPRWRTFLRDLLDVPGVRVSDGAPWKQGVKPDAAINVGIGFEGLQRLLPESMGGTNVKDALGTAFPAYVAGMPSRARILGDDTSDEDWAPWKERQLWISVSARNEKALTEHVKRLQERASNAGVALEEALRGHADFDADGLVREPFGFKDGFSNPVVAGDPMLEPKYIPGNCRYDAKLDKWYPIAAGEFLLGYENERRQNALTGALGPLAPALRNGTFAVLRDLEQDVDAFHRFVAKAASQYGQDPDFVAHKMMGRTKDGEPLARPGSGNLFTYEDDKSGARCPFGSHIRRTNPRNTGERRILRRGMPYRHPRNHGTSNGGGSGVRQGLYFLALNASIDNQFEFVQQMWVNGPTGALTGASDPISTSVLACGNMAIEGDVKAGRPPILVRNVPAFLTCRGGQYFFMPGIEGLRVIAGGPRA